MDRKYRRVRPVDPDQGLPWCTYAELICRIILHGDDLEAFSTEFLAVKNDLFFILLGLVSATRVYPKKKTKKSSQA